MVLGNGSSISVPAQACSLLTHKNRNDEGGPCSMIISRISFINIISMIDSLCFAASLFVPYCLYIYMILYVYRESIVNVL